jgi:hypothetical protein
MPEAYQTHPTYTRMCPDMPLPPPPTPQPPLTTPESSLAILLFTFVLDACTEYGDHWTVSVMEEDCVNVESAFVADQIQLLYLKMYDKT